MKRISIRKTYEMEYNQPQDEKMNKYFSRSLEKLIHRIRYQQYCRKEKSYHLSWRRTKQNRTFMLLKSNNMKDNVMNFFHDRKKLKLKETNKCV